MLMKTEPYENTPFSATEPPVNDSTNSRHCFFQIFCVRVVFILQRFQMKMKQRERERK